MSWFLYDFLDSILFSVLASSFGCLYKTRVLKETGTTSSLLTVTGKRGLLPPSTKLTTVSERFNKYISN